MLNIAVCDDQLLSIKKFIDVMESYLNEIDAEYSIDLYGDEIEMIDNIKIGCKYDIYILDIEMPIQGDQLLEEIRRYDSDFLVGFVSNYDNMGNIVCRSRADIYVYKSMDEEKMLYEIKQLFKIYFYNKTTCTFRTKFGLVEVETRKIKYIESQKRELIVHTLIGEDFKILDNTLSSLEHDSDFYCFSRVGRSHLINFRGVDTVKEKSIIFLDGEELQFSWEKIRSFKKDWQYFLFKELK